jgi:hypothetical protein
MGLFIRVCERVQLETVEGNALRAEPDFGQVRPHLGVELVPVHAEVAGCVQVPDEAGLDLLDAHDCVLTEVVISALRIERVSAPGAG